MVLGCLAYQAQAVDGGEHCQYVSPRELTAKLTKVNGGTAPTAAQYHTALAQLAKTNNYICSKCISKKGGVEKTQVGVVQAGYGQCTCKAGYGSWTYVVGATAGKDTGKQYQGFGCSKCPNGVRGPNTYDGTTVNINVGPFNPAISGSTALTWTGTRCTCRVTATGAAC